MVIMMRIIITVMIVIIIIILCFTITTKRIFHGVRRSSFLYTHLGHFPLRQAHNSGECSCVGTTHTSQS